MTDKEKIIIDGVDVKNCRRRIGKNNYCRYFKRLCSENNFNCVWKQLTRKTQECEELKRKLSNQEQLYQNEIEIYNESCLQLRQENDDLYLERLALNTANSGINSLLEIKEQEYEKLQEQISKIKEYVRHNMFDVERENWFEIFIYTFEDWKKSILENENKYKKECEKLKNELDLYKTWYRAKHDDVKNLLGCYRKALEEIEKYCNSVSVEENLYNSRHFYNGGVTVEVVNEILNIISKAKGEGNE